MAGSAEGISVAEKGDHIGERIRASGVLGGRDNSVGEVLLPCVFIFYELSLCPKQPSAR